MLAGQGNQVESLLFSEISLAVIRQWAIMLTAGQLPDVTGGTGGRLGRLLSFGRSFDSETDLDSPDVDRMLSDEVDFESELDGAPWSDLEVLSKDDPGETSYVDPDTGTLDRLDYKSIRRRSIAIEQFKENREAAKLITLWNADIQHRERKIDDDDDELLLVDFPRRRAVSFSGRVVTSETHHKMVVKNEPPCNFRRYRRGSKNEQIVEAEIENWKEKRRHSGPPDRSDFEESLAAYREREKRRRSSYRLHACEQDFSGTDFKCVFVTAVILMALGAVMCLSYWMKKRLWQTCIGQLQSSRVSL